MQWNNTTGLFKRILSLPTLTVKPVIWDKWCDRPCAYWEPTQQPEDFRPGIALVVCYSPFQDLPQDNLRDKKTISMSLVYISEHWILPSFIEEAYVVNHTRDAKDPRGMVSLAWIHKRSPFYPDISFKEYKQHLTILPLTPPTEDGFGLCGYAKNFAVSALHRRPDNFNKGREITSWVPPAFRRAPPRELVLVTGSGSKIWGYTSGVPERHDVPMAPLDSFVQLSTTEARELILPEYTFALCILGSWPFPSLMDKNYSSRNLSPKVIRVEKTLTPQTSPRRLVSRRVKRPRKGPKVPVLQVVPPRLTRLEPRQTPKPMKNVPSK